MAFGPDGDLYVVNHEHDEEHVSILRFDGTTGEFVSTFVEQGGEYIVFGPDQNLYAQRGFAPKVLRYDGMTGEFIDEVMSLGFRSADIGSFAIVGNTLFYADYASGVKSVALDTYSVVLAGGQTAADIDFGNRRHANSQIGGQTWNDIDGDHERDPGELGINGWEIQLINDQGVVVDTQMTADRDLNNDGTIDPETERGLYRFTGLGEGTYSVRQVPRRNWMLPSAIGGGVDQFIDGTGGGFLQEVTVGADGNLLVLRRGGEAENYNAQILRYDVSSGAFIDVFVPSLPLSYNYWSKMSLGPDGTGDSIPDLYLLSQSGNAGAMKLIRYDGVTGAFAGVVLTSSEISGFAFHSDGFVYTSRAWGGEIARWDPSTGAFDSIFVPESPTRNSRDPAFRDFQDLIFGPDGDLYVANGSNAGTRFDSILKFDGNTGEFISTFVEPGTGGLYGAYHMAFGPDQNLYAFSGVTPSVLRYDGMTGAFIDAVMTLGDRSADLGGFAIVGNKLFYADYALSVKSVELDAYSVVLAAGESAVDIDFGNHRAEAIVEIDDATNLLIQDISGGDTDDTLTIVVDGLNIRVTDPNNQLAAGNGAIQIDANTVDVPIASITGATGIIVDTLGGDDSLVVDLSGGIFPMGIDYRGGTQNQGTIGDSLTLQGALPDGTTVEHTEFTFGDSNNGSVQITGSLASAIESWGETGTGQVAHAPPGDSFMAVAAGDDRIMGLMPDGQIVSWGFDDDTYGQVSNTPTDDGFTAIAAGRGHSLALKSDGSIVSWGYDRYRQVSNTPSGNDFIAIAAGNHHSLALKSNGSIVSWGTDSSGQLSDTPTGHDFTAIAAGRSHSVALRSDGSIVSWGTEAQGEITLPPAGNDFTAIAAGDQHNLALRSDGSIVSWGFGDPYGQLANTPGGNDFTAIAAASHHSLALRSDGSIVSWGNDAFRQVSDTPLGIDFNTIAAGFGSSLAIRRATVRSTQINFTGLEPIMANISATNVTLNYSDAAETIEVTEAGSNQTTVSSTAAQRVTFNDPTEMLAINAGGGDDTIDIKSLAANYPANLVIDGEAGMDDLKVDETISFAANKNLSVTVEQVTENANGSSSSPGAIIFQGSGNTFSFTQPTSELEGIDVLDIRGTGDNTLMVDADRIRNAFLDREILVVCDSGDEVIFDHGWEFSKVVVSDGRLVRQFTNGGAVLNLSGPEDFTNPINEFDVNGSGAVTMLDALHIINELGRRVYSQGTSAARGEMRYSAADLDEFRFYDVSRDGRITSHDLLRVINQLSGSSGLGAAGASVIGNANAAAENHAAFSIPDSEVPVQQSSEKLKGLSWSADDEPRPITELPLPESEPAGNREELVDFVIESL